MQEKLKTVSDKIASIASAQAQYLYALSEEILVSKKNKQDRTIKDLVGHLIDTASHTHQRVVRLQYCDMPELPAVFTRDHDLWITLQDYRSEEWENLVQLWRSFNLHLAHIISHIDPLSAENSCGDSEGNCITLVEVIDGYLWHLRLHLDEIHELAGD